MNHLTLQLPAGGWHPPMPSIASRKPSSRSKMSFRGALIYAKRNRLIVYESLLEQKSYLIAMADNSVADIHDQPPALAYRDSTGRTRHHVFDTLLTLIDARRIAVAVKYEADVVKSGLPDIIERIKKTAHGRAFADQYVIRTERQITRARVENATLVLRARRLKREEDVQQLARLAAGYKGAINSDDLLNRFRADHLGFNALVCLIDEGFLQIVGSGLIRRGCSVVVGRAYR